MGYNKKVISPLSQKTNDKRHKEKNAFTIVEIMVVIGIMTLLTAVTISYSRDGERQIILYKDEAIITGLLNRAKSLTLQRYRNRDLDVTYETCAFGVRFELSGDFFLFQDIGTGDCGTEAGTNDYKYTDGADPTEKLDSFKLDPRYYTFQGLPGEGMEILFIPPNLYASSTAPNFGTDPAKIVLGSIEEPSLATISVSHTGQIRGR